ncbi:Cytochrome c [Gimesia panareensis]|uniref:Cytochrome c n=1 Tax=Gimesia panareensis TaxID=2527978 RepID=A0A518FPF5_9PLAN|nr:cytochrome c [Gimesia panareensis]QDV18232.1 Cytochrome c [Gimesia panareensis]
MRFGFSRLILLLLFPLISLTGCEQPQVDFVFSKKTNELIPAAAKPVKEALVRQFGNPFELTQFEGLPTNFGDVEGTVKTVEAPSGEEKLIRLQVEGLQDAYNKLQGLPLEWTSGKGQGQISRIKEYNYETGTIAVEKTAEIDPQPGDTFLVECTRLQFGRDLYNRHCMHCHGMSGEGTGPTSRYLNPPPRDFRLGIYKYTSTKPTAKAQKADLERTVKEGIAGTYMPSFKLLTDDEVAAIVNYVIWLSMRGETEKKLVDELFFDYSKEVVAERTSEDGGEKPEEIQEELKEYMELDFPDTLEFATSSVADAWEEANMEDAIVVPGTPRVPDTPESRERGRKLYLSDKTKCATCHGPQGRGNGTATQDFWTNPVTNKKYPDRGLHDIWGNQLPPRDLHRGIYRGGRRPIDVYRRMYSGIKGTPMPAFGGPLSDEELWDLVNYVMSLPYSKN